MNYKGLGGLSQELKEWRVLWMQRKSRPRKGRNLLSLGPSLLAGHSPPQLFQQRRHSAQTACAVRQAPPALDGHGPGLTWFMHQTACELRCSVVSYSLWPPGLKHARLFCPWSFPGKNTGVGCHFPHQGIFPTQGLNPDLLHCRQILYCLRHQ